MARPLCTLCRLKGGFAVLAAAIDANESLVLPGQSLARRVGRQTEGAIQLRYELFPPVNISHPLSLRSAGFFDITTDPN
jgi:hypothetical protein